MAAAEPSTASRRTLYTAVAVSVLLAISIAVAAARPDAAEPAQVAKQPARATDASASVPTSDVPSAPIPAAPTQPPTDSGAGTGASAGVQAPNAAPAQPVKTGSKLTQLKSPPERTIGMIVIPDDFTSARFSVTFTPYGWGPSGAAGGRLVARITESEALDAGAKALNRDFSNRNATLWCSKAVTDKIKVGGTYSGMLEVRRSGDTGMLIVTELRTP